jgi:phage terminase Nu1 subunit (DNA packaging protein)
MAGTFLKIQEKRLAVSSEQLNELAKDIESNKVHSSKEVEDTFSRAISALDHQQAMIPVMAGANTLYMDEADYHLARAKARLNKKDNKAAAGDIRKAEAYLKLKAVHASEKTKAGLVASAAELEDLAGKVESGAVTEAKDLEEVFKRAHKAVRNAL